MLVIFKSLLGGDITNLNSPTKASFKQGMMLLDLPKGVVINDMFMNVENRLLILCSDEKQNLSSIKEIDLESSISGKDPHHLGSQDLSSNWIEIEVDRVYLGRSEVDIEQLIQNYLSRESQGLIGNGSSGTTWYTQLKTL